MGPGRMTVTLAPAGGLGDAAAEGRLMLEVALDARGHPDAAARRADPLPWPARRTMPGTAEEAGDVALDADGWLLRFPADPDGAPFRLRGLEGGLRPGEVVTLAGPDGAETAWRVVGLG